MSTETEAKTGDGDKPLNGGLVDAETLANLLWANSKRKPCRESIMRRARAKQIPSIRFGRNVFFDPTEVWRALNAD